jgi:hypothetical protein
MLGCGSFFFFYIYRVEGEMDGEWVTYDRQCPSMRFLLLQWCRRIYLS